MGQGGEIHRNRFEGVREIHRLSQFDEALGQTRFTAGRAAVP
jgi:hypothetical protein